MSPSVEVVDQTTSGPGSEPVADVVAQLVTAVLVAEGIEGCVEVAFVDEATIEELNTRYREAGEPTDVLSFRYADEEDDWPEPEGEDAAEGADELGEIVVCPEVVRRYATEEGSAPARQMGWTLIHGTLHLVGYDHESDEGQMRDRERALLEDLAPLVTVGLLPEETDGPPEG